MLYTLPGMILALLVVSLAFHRTSIPSVHSLTAGLTSTTGGILVPGASYPANLSLTVLGGMAAYVAAYATGLGNIPWQQGELFALQVRGIGSSVATATNWACNLLIAATFLSLMDAATPAGAFALYALVCVAGWVGCYCLYPETSGLSLEQVNELFSDGFGVQKSLEVRAGRMAREDEVRRRVE